MTPEIPYVLAEDLSAHILLSTSQIDFLLDEADHHAEHGQDHALQAITICLAEPLDVLTRLTVPLEGLHAQIDTPEREDIRQRAVRRLRDINERIHTSGLNAYDSDNLAMATEDEDVSVHLMSTVLHILAASTAQQALAEAVHDQSIPLEQRWAHLSALYEAMTLTQKYVQDPSEALEPLNDIPEGHDIAWLRLGQLLIGVVGDELPYSAAMAALCQDSGINHHSKGSIAFPDAVRFMVEYLQPDREWELGRVAL